MSCLYPCLHPCLYPCLYTCLYPACTAACTPAASQPTRHLLLGNVSSRPNESALETVFGKFGALDSVKVFPGKTYALVSFKDLPPAAEAMQCLDGHSLLSVSGHSPPPSSPSAWALPNCLLTFLVCPSVCCFRLHALG